MTILCNIGRFILGLSIGIASSWGVIAEASEPLPQTVAHNLAMILKPHAQGPTSQFSVIQGFKEDSGSYILWLSNGGRTGEGLVGIFDEMSHLVSVRRFEHPIRNVSIHEMRHHGPMLAIRVISASGTALHEESIHLFRFPKLDKAVWEGIIIFSSLGPYPEGKRARSLITLKDTADEITLCKITALQTLLESQEWTEPILELESFRLRKGDTSFTIVADREEIIETVAEQK